jgi:hypothetical protein
VGIGHRAFACAIFRRPLMRTRRTLGQFPFEVEQIIEKVVTPLGRCLGPNNFQAAADGVSTKAFSEFILPAEALQFDFGAFRLGADVVPPAISATVSSSFMAMRLNVSRMSLAAATGSGFPLGPSGFT